MATARTDQQYNISHVFGGGWATDFGQSFMGSPQMAGRDGRIVIPFLTDARNTVYEFDGGPRKAPGTSLFNSTDVSATGNDILGLYDYWRMGTAGTATQRRIIHVGTAIMEDQGTSIFQNLFTGMDSGAVPHYDTFNDLLIIGSSSTTDVPRSWDGTTAQNLAGSPPRFSFSVHHKNRQWAAGVWTTPSRLHYSVAGNPEDWTGIGSGTIDLDINDGDMITGLASHKDRLFVFKGPYRGSIHIITGSTPTGNDAFVRTTFVRNLPVGWINAIFPFADDLGFMTARGTIHSLAATSAYGDFNQAYLSYPIGMHCREEMNHSRARFWWAVSNPNLGQTWILYTGSGQTTNNRMLIMDYRFLAQGERYPRWSYWDSRAFGSLALVVDTSNRPRLMAGGYDGFVYKLENTTRDDTGTAITQRVTTPFLTYGDEWHMKTLCAVGLNMRPYNNNEITVGWQRDGQTAQSTTVTQGGGGFLLDTDVLGTGVLGGAGRFITRFASLEEGGEFRYIQYDFREANGSTDCELHGFAAAIEPGGVSWEN